MEGKLGIRHHPRFNLDFPRPSSVLLHSKALLAVVWASALALGLIAALHPAWLLTVDRPISDVLRTGNLVDLFQSITTAGSQRIGGAVSVVAAVFLWKRCKALAMAFPVLVLAGVLADVTIKLAVDRPRPPNPIVGTGLGSFPSGHVIQAAITFGLLPPAVYIITQKRMLFWSTVALSLLAVAAVALSRVYLGAHWPSDVTASFLIGASLLLGAEYLVASEVAGSRCKGCALHRPHEEREEQ